MAMLVTKAIFDSRLRGFTPDISDPEIMAWRDIVRRDGVHVVRNFLPTDLCSRFQSEVDVLMGRYPDAIQVDAKRADHRLFLGSLPPGAVQKFFSDVRLITCAAAFLGHDVANLATLAGRLSAVPGNIGSGGGWHRDSFTNQFKAIIYISDVGQDNGPFQYIRGSHRLSAMIRDRRRAALGRCAEPRRERQNSKTDR